MLDSRVQSGKRASVALKIWKLLAPSKRRSALVLVALMLVGMILETVGVGLVVPAVALLTQPAQVRDIQMLQPVLEWFGNPGNDALVAGGVLVLVLVYFVKGVFLAWLAWRQAKLAFEVQAELSQRLFSLYLTQPYTFHLQRNSAQLIRNAMNEVAHFTGNAMIPSMQLLTETLVVVGLCSLLVVVEPLGATLVIGVLGSAAWAFHSITRRRILYWGKRRLFHDGFRIQHLQQGLGGVKDVKLLGREAEFLAQYRYHNIKSARMGHYQKTLQQLPRLWLEVLAVVGLAALVLAMLAQGRSVASIVPALGLFAAAAFRLLPSINRLISAAQSLRYGLPVIDVLHSELQLEEKHDSRVTAEPAFDDRLEVSNVTYTYPGASVPALIDLSIRINRGECVGFIGPSGAGKSTLVDILLGLLMPDKGTVRVDGDDIRQMLRGWQNRIGYVPQSIFLTDESLRRNVAFGLADEDIDDNAVARAISAAQLESFVLDLPEGLDTVVGERGIRLSGGQRQRIGIARALYHDPQVLVLDEATSSLDTDTECGVMQAVQKLQGKKTIVIVAHRLSTVSGCDRLHRLHGGRIVEEGRAEDVLARSVKSN